MTIGRGILAAAQALLAAPTPGQSAAPNWIAVCETGRKAWDTSPRANETIK